MAPEQLLGSAVNLPASDTWSAACVVAHMALGRPLFTGSTPADVLLSIIALVGPITKRWPAASVLPLAGVIKAEEARRREAKRISGKTPPPPEEQLRAAGVPKHLSRLLQSMLIVDPSQRPTLKTALGDGYFKKYVAASEPLNRALLANAGDERSSVAAVAASAVASRIGGTSFFVGSDDQLLLTPTTFRASLPYPKSEIECIPPHNEGASLPDDFQPPSIVSEVGLSAPSAAPVDIDPFPYMRPCVFDPESIVDQEAAASMGALMPQVGASSKGQSAAAAASAGAGVLLQSFS